MAPVFISKARKPAGSLTLLAGDIGATKTNLALLLLNGERLSIIEQKTYHTKDYIGIHEMLQNFIPFDKKPEVFCLGVAGPIQRNKATLTNIHWEIDAPTLSKQWENTPVFLLNDIEAIAFGLGIIKEEDTYLLHPGKEGNKGNIGIIAPGTGLGEAGLFWDGESYHPFATEGGHSDFSPRTAFDYEFFTYLQKKYGHVSWERILSGPGIYSIFQFLRDRKEKEEPAWLAEKLLVHDAPAVISEYATACEICSETMGHFFRYLAHESANLVLKLKATGGLYVGGGIMRKNINLLDKHVFFKHYCNSGRLNPLLEVVPISVIVNDKIALLGAAYYAAYVAAFDPTWHLATL